MKDIFIATSSEVSSKIENARQMIQSILLDKLNEYPETMIENPHLKLLQMCLEKWSVLDYCSDTSPSLYETICKETFEGNKWKELLKSPLNYICSHPLYNKLYEEDICLNHLGSNVLEECISLIDIRGTWNVIELGAGTGGFMNRLYPLIESKVEEYRATDLYLLREYPWKKVTTQSLNIDKKIPVSLQEKFDLIVSCNCIHVSKNILDCLKNISSLVKEGGYLLIEEMISDFPITMFGLDEQIWNIAEDHRDFGLWMSLDVWKDYISKSCWNPVICYRSNHQMLLLLQKCKSKE